MPRDGPFGSLDVGKAQATSPAALSLSSHFCWILPEKDKAAQAL